MYMLVYIFHTEMQHFHQSPHLYFLHNADISLIYIQFNKQVQQTSSEFKHHVGWSFNIIMMIRAY